MTVPNHTANQVCPAIREISRAIRAVYPHVGLGDLRSDGSRHTAGLALDISLCSRDPVESAIAARIIAALIEVHAQAQWASILYTDWHGDVPFYFCINGHTPYGRPFLQKRGREASELLELRDHSKGNDRGRYSSALTLGRAHRNHIHLDYYDWNLRLQKRNGPTGVEYRYKPEHENPVDPSWQWDRQIVADWPRHALSSGFSGALMAAIRRREGAETNEHQAMGLSACDAVLRQAVSSGVRY